MINISKRTLLSNVKTRLLGLGLAGALLIGAPIGVTYAHGNHQWKGNDNNSRQNQARWQGNQWWQGANHGNNNGNGQPSNEEQCEQRQNAINEAVATYKTEAQAKLDKLGAYVTSQQAFVDEHNLEVAHYDKLNTKVANAQTGFSVKINDLSASTIDCDTPERKDMKVLQSTLKDTKAAKADLTHAVKQLSYAIISTQ